MTTTWVLTHDLARCIPMNALSHHELSDLCLRNIRLLFLPFCLIGVPDFLIALRRRTATAGVYFTASLSSNMYSSTVSRTEGSPRPAEVAQEICMRTGGKALLAGSISRLGGQYMVGLEASSLRTKLGESLASVQKLAHNGTAAAAEFQKFLNHRGIMMNFPLGALAHLGLVRAYVLSGDTAKARTAYQDFFALWKDADPDIPILKEAKAEYAKLQ